MKTCKILLACVLALALAVGAALPTSAATKMVANSRYSLPTINAIANVQAIDGTQATALLETEEHPGTVLVDVGDVADLTAFLKLCMKTNTLPTLRAESPEDGKAILDAMSKASCNDLNVISTNVPVLKNIRKNKSLVRTGLIVDLPDGELTSEQAGEIRATVRSVPATFCVIDVEDARYKSVTELRHLAVAIWVQVETDPADPAFSTDVLTAVTSSANGVISADSSAVAEVLNTYLEEAAMTRVPVMIGHRGNPSQAPENSLSGFIEAYQNGADVFEVDVEITKDGEIVIMHDANLNRTTDYDGDEYINNMTLKEIKSYHLLAGDGSISEETVPTLREVLEEFQDKDCRIFIEFKGSNEKNVAATAKLIEEFGMEDRVDVISFSINLIGKTQSVISGMSTGYLHTPYGSVRSYEDILDMLSTSLYGAQTTNSSINPNNKLMTPMFIQAATERGMTVWPWTYNANSNDNGFMLCPDGVTTDDMQWVTDMSQYVSLENQPTTVGVGASVEAAVSAVSFGNEPKMVQKDALVIKVIDGEECLKVENGALVGLAAGEATVLFGVRTETTNHSGYVLYAQPVTITVGGDGLFWWIIAGVVVVLAVTGTGFILFRKKKANA